MTKLLSSFSKIICAYLYIIFKRFVVFIKNIANSFKFYNFIPISFNTFIDAIVIATHIIGFQGIAGNFGALSLI